MDGSNAAQNLQGRTLSTGWKVIEKVTKNDNDTGGNFSVSYKVEKDNEICFLKAFDINKFVMQAGDKPFFDVMEEMSSAYNYEKELSLLCQGNHVTKVIYVRDFGEERLNDFVFPIVPYLIFDLANGDVRSKLDFSKNLDYAWSFQSLHNVAVGLKQLHSLNISHQDIKPSNILVFEKESKIGDLGRSLCKSVEGPYSKAAFCGQRSYAPPEIVYHYYEEDWNKRVFATDCFLLGSLIVFYFIGVPFNRLLYKHIPNEMRISKEAITFEEIEPYLINAYDTALNDMRESLNGVFFTEELVSIVEKLCHPNPKKRGHPKNILRLGNQYSMERFITKFDVLSKKVRLEYLNIKI